MKDKKNKNKTGQPAATKQLLSRNEFAKQAGCSPAAVSKAVKDGRVFKESNGQYDLANQLNRVFIASGKINRKPQFVKSDRAKKEEQIRPELENIDTDHIPASLPPSLETLYREKLQAETERINEARRKLQIENSRSMKGLIPQEVNSLQLGLFAFCISNNILQIGNRVARGDIKLRDKIEAETKRAIEKTLQYIDANMKHFGDDLKADREFAEKVLLFWEEQDIEKSRKRFEKKKKR